MSDREHAYDAAAEVGFKVLEMTDKVVMTKKFATGARAAWNFEVDDVRFLVTVAIVEEQSDG